MGGMPRVVPLTVMVLGMLLAGCSQEDDPGADLLGADRPTFTSVAALNRDADAAVLGTVEGVIGTELDNGGNPESDTAGLDATGADFTSGRFGGTEIPSLVWVIGWIVPSGL